MNLNRKVSEKILFEKLHIATIIKPLEANDGLSFYTNDDNYIQVGIWKYPNGKRLETHYHNTFTRESMKTNETVYVVKGKLKCNLYLENGTFISSHTINEGELIVQFNGAHEYFIEEDSIIIETKNGPYFGPEKDRTRI